MPAARDVDLERTEAEDPDAPPQPPLSRVRTVVRVAKIGALLFALAVIWLTVTAPLSRSLQPIGAPGLTILSAEGEPIARRGAVIEAPVSVTELPPHVGEAFIAIEDRRFYSHIGIDPWGISRAMVRNLRAGRVREGGSTISQQLAKTSFLSPERTAARKLQEALITLWLEVWLSKEEILSRYLSNVYFGDNVYGLRAAARHYFDSEPDELTVAQAAMLAGIVNAPSRLAPTNNLDGAQERSRLVMREMVQAGFLTEEEHDEIRPARLRLGERDDVPTGTYFADWVIPQASELAEGTYGERQVLTTLEGDLQRLAVRTIRRAGLGRAQVALVAMRLDGRVVAMVGGKDYRRSSFNRATQARRQPGSAFKPFVYLAAFRAGYRPTTPVNDVPIRLGDWEPRNYSGDYRGRISLREAVAYSSNSVAVQIQERVGRDNVIRAARDLGITTSLRPDPSLALGTNGVSLVELTAAYAAIAAGRFPIRPHGLPERTSWFGGGTSADALNRDPAFPMLRDVLHAVVNRGTGRAAALSIPTFGKTGTTSDYRDAWFVGFAGDLVVGIWVGNDDNSPLPGTTGGGIPARIWRDFMADALGIRPVRRPAPVPLSQTDRTPEPTNPDNGLVPTEAEPPVVEPGNAPAPGQTPTPDLVLPPVTVPREQLPPPPEPEQ
ncbi:transglycosylase domain-containing protein [Sphingosinicella sp. CPCC 101087]|uniref:transglycosylase domain-containing protein n=1 Tax=Sphingosinicella sp. CPCC 101087 TaxID=2497754 RepID=UPI00101CF4B0|nr:transglycosylase domain-containing protein [Sphingosinicella sp. CPCC 101087]